MRLSTFCGLRRDQEQVSSLTGEAKMWHPKAQLFFQVHHSINLSSICPISGHRFPENILKNPEIYFLRLVFFPGNLLSQTGFYLSEIFLSDRFWSGERTTGHGNFQRIV
jgi:hypothetical protein